MTHTLVSMIRGINVGGHRPLKMDRLRALHAALGLRDARTYLQSGNTVFEAPTPGADGHALALERRILDDRGFEVAVAVRSAAEMTAVVRANPFLGRAAVDPRFLHATFLVRHGVKASLDGVVLPLAGKEAAVLLGDTVYLYCPDGYGNSRISNAFFERKLSSGATTRNWQTVTALERMARGEAVAP